MPKRTNSKEKKKKRFTNNQQELYESAKICYTCKEKFEHKNTSDKKYHKVRDHCPYTCGCRSAAHSICNLNYSVPKEIPIVFHK